MTLAPHLDPTKRHDFVLLYEVTNGNPNGDPDAGGAPRADVTTGHGLVTDVAIKRKIRNIVPLVTEGRDGYNIFVQASSDVALNTAIDEIVEKVPEKKAIRETRGVLVERMCEQFFDVRMFGAVLSTGNAKDTSAKVQGPVQLTFGESLNPVDLTTYTITRQAPTKEGDTPTMGNKSAVSYGLYRQYGFFSPYLAERTGVRPPGEGSDVGDLAVFWAAIEHMFTAVDRSAARGMMSLRGLVIFSHDSKLGCAPAHALFESISIVSDALSPRQFSDYTVSLPEELPAGVSMEVLVRP